MCGVLLRIKFTASAAAGIELGAERDQSITIPKPAGHPHTGWIRPRGRMFYGGFFYFEMDFGNGGHSTGFTPEPRHGT